jgi:ASC-1-like (ASCH) protein
MSNREVKLKIIAAGHRAVEELIKVAQEKIIAPDSGDDLSADKLKNAAATKKLAIFDAFEILNKIEAEREALDFADRGISKVDSKQGFAERRSK